MSFCSKPNYDCEEKNETSQFVATNGNDCTLLSSKFNLNNTYQLINISDPQEGIIIGLDSGEECKSDPKLRYKVTIIMKCRKDSDFVLLKDNKFSLDKCFNTIEIADRNACPKIREFDLENFYIIPNLTGIIYLVCGLFTNIMGVYCRRMNLFLFNFHLILQINFFVFFTLGSENQIEHLILIRKASFIGLHIVGIAVGYLSALFHKAKLHHIIQGVLVGYYAMLMVFHIFFDQIATHQNHNDRVHLSNLRLTFYVMTIVFCILGGIIFTFITYIKQEYRYWLDIIAFSFLGSFSLMRGISLFIGFYFNEYLLIDLNDDGELWQAESVISLNLAECEIPTEIYVCLVLSMPQWNLLPVQDPGC